MQRPGHTGRKALAKKKCRAWQAKVLAECAPRKTMGSIQLMSSALTTEALTQWPDEDRALLRNCLNGTFFTADRRKHHKQAQSTDCKFCLCPDSQMHRHWFCPYFTECRSIPADHVADLELLPQAITCHGWVPEPPALVPFKQACVALYDEPVDFQWPPALPEHLHLFTDGTCLAPACRLTRLAAWGFVLAQPGFQEFWPVANGLLPGWTHSVLRAEIWAAIQACDFALQACRPCTLWIDNHLVYRRICQFRSRPCWIKPNQKDADLWNLLYRCVHCLGTDLHDVVKVCSHQSLDGADDAVEDWAFQGNQAADSLADSSFLNAAAIWSLWCQLTQQVAHIRTLRSHVHSTMVRIGRKAVHSRVDSIPVVPGSPRAPRVAAADVQSVSVPQLDPTSLPDHLYFEGCDRFLAWIQQQDVVGEVPRLISWFQLNLAFEIDLRCKGVQYLTKRRQWTAASASCADDFAKRTNRLARWFRNVVESGGGACRAAHVRPDSGIIQFWTMCVQLRWPFEQWHATELRLRDHQTQLHSVKEVRGLS